MVRLVFRPYTQIRRSICTSESLRASTRVSSGFALFRHSSPSFGSQHACSTADPSQQVWSGRRCSPRGGSQPSPSLRAWVFHPNTRRHVRLLGPCFKTGRLKPLCQHPGRGRGLRPGLAARRVPQSQPMHAIEGYKHIRGCHIPPTLLQRPRLVLTRRPGSAPHNCGADPRPTRLTSSVSLSTISRTV
jgi:hypothetical protein